MKKLLVRLSNNYNISQHNQYKQNVFNIDSSLKRNTFDSFVPAFKSSEIVTKDSVEHKKINSIYQEILKKPFTFVTSICKYAGEKGDKIPEVLRDNNCTGLGAMLKNELAKNGYKDSYFLALGGQRHYGLVSNIKDNWFLFDPAWAIVEPVNLTEVYNSSTKKNIVKTFPNVNSPQNYILLSYPKEDNNIIDIFIKEQNEIERNGTFCLTNRLENRPSIENVEKIIYTSNQPYIDLKTLDINTGERNCLGYPVAKCFEDKIQDEKYLYIKNSTGGIYKYGELEFIKYLKDMSRNLMLKEEEIIDYVMHGVDLFFKNAPANFKYKV